MAPMGGPVSKGTQTMTNSKELLTILRKLRLAIQLLSNGEFEAAERQSKHCTSLIRAELDKPPLADKPSTK